MSALAGATLAAQTPAQKPNIIFILADDLGMGDVGCYGQKIIQTPNIDRIAAEGIRFTQAYAGDTVCAKLSRRFRVADTANNRAVRPVRAGDLLFG